MSEYPLFREKLFRQDQINRKYMKTEDAHPQTRTFAGGLKFIRSNHREDRWMLQIEAFDPHEPFFSPEAYKRLSPHAYDGKLFDWPNYDRVRESPAEVEHGRMEYTALLSMCDASLDKIMDAMHYDIRSDPEQAFPLQDREAEQCMKDRLHALLAHHDAPEEQYERLGLNHRT